MSDYSFHFLSSVSDTATILSPLVRKLRSFGNLREGWCHGEGLPVDQGVISTAEELAKIATELQLRADAFPGLHGDCSVAFYRDETCVEVLINPNHPKVFGLHVEEGVGPEFTEIESKEDADFVEVERKIVALAKDEWTSPGFSRFVNLMENAVDFQMLSLSTLRDPGTPTRLMAS